MVRGGGDRAGRRAAGGSANASPTGLLGAPPGRAAAAFPPPEAVAGGGAAATASAARCTGSACHSPPPASTDGPEAASRDRSRRDLPEQYSGHRRHDLRRGECRRRVRYDEGLPVGYYARLRLHSGDGVYHGGEETTTTRPRLLRVSSQGRPLLTSQLHPTEHGDHCRGWWPGRLELVGRVLGNGQMWPSVAGTS